MHSLNGILIDNIIFKLMKLGEIYIVYYLNKQRMHDSWSWNEDHRIEILYADNINDFFYDKSGKRTWKRGYTPRRWER